MWIRGWQGITCSHSKSTGKRRHDDNDNKDDFPSSAPKFVLFAALPTPPHLSQPHPVQRVSTVGRSVGRSSVVTFVLAIFNDNQNHPLTHPPLITSYSHLCMLPRALFLHSTFTPRWWWSSSPSSSSSSSHRRRVVSVLLAVVCIPEQSRELNKLLVFVAHFHFSHPPPSPYDADDGKVLFPLHCHTSSHVLSSVHTHSLL